MVPGDFKVDPANLQKASKDIFECLKPAAKLDLEGASGSGGWYGHEGVYAALARFCPTWQIAVALLTQRAGTAGQALVGMAKKYMETDETGGQRMKHVESGLAPH